MDKPIFVFVRHCGVSSNSVNKTRPDWFSKEVAFQNLLTTKDDNTFIYIMLDSASTEHPEEHFAYKYSDTHGVKIVPMKGGSDAHSFINMIEYVCGLEGHCDNLDGESIIYLLEDDYVHRSGWCQAMREAFHESIADYVTLYDHPDKYLDQQMYGSLHSKVFATTSCHWRTTPSTTNTYAMKFKTLLENKHDHIRFSCKVVGFTFDHAKFVFLNNIGKQLVSSIPAFSTHVENRMLSPTIDWRNVAEVGKINLG